MMDRTALKTALSGVKLQPNNPMKFTSSNVQFVNVDYLRPLKLKATVTFADGGRMVTREATRSTSTGTDAAGFNQYQSEYDGNYRDGVAELSTVVMGNGGIWMRLAEPIKMDASTVKNAELVLVYDPYLNLRAQRMDTGEAPDTTGTSLMVDSVGNKWLVPIMSTIPILVPNGDQVWREVYRIDAAIDYDVKLVLYYLKDTPTKLKGAALGVARKSTAAVLPTTVQSQLPNVFFLENEGAVWSFQDYTR
jgi:hypothetical protein